jgi:hypothetical protein
MPKLIIENSTLPKTFVERVNFYAHLLQSEKELNALPNAIIVALSYIFGMMWQVKLMFTAAEAQLLYYEYKFTGGQWMTEEEIQAALLWESGHYPTAIPFSLVAISSATTMLFVIYTTKRLFKDFSYLLSAIRHPFAKPSPAITKRNQRALRATLTISALIFGAIFVGAAGFSLALVKFVSIAMIAGLTALGFASGFVPALVGALALAFAVGFAVHHLIRFYNAYQASWNFQNIQENRDKIAQKLNINLTFWDKIKLGNLRLWFATMETNPLLRVKSGETDLLVASRSTWHSWSKVFGVVGGILLFPVFLQLPILLPAAYIGYKVFDNILSDLATYKNSGRNWGHALLKVTGLIIASAMILSPPGAAAIIIAAGVFAGLGFVYVVSGYIKKLWEKEYYNLSIDANAHSDDDLNHLIKHQTEVFQKAKYKLERDNFVSALINWPAKILAKHFFRLAYSENGWVKLGVYFFGILPLILTALEMTGDFVLFIVVRPLLRTAYFISEIALDIWLLLKPETGAPYNQDNIKANQPLSFGRFFSRCFQHFKNLLNIVNFAQGTEYQNKRNQNTWKATQAKDTIEAAHQAIALQDGKTTEPQMTIKENDDIELEDLNNTKIQNPELQDALLKINLNREKWRATYEHKAEQAKDKPTIHKTDIIEQTDQYIKKTCLNMYKDTFSVKLLVMDNQNTKENLYTSKANRY